MMKKLLLAAVVLALVVGGVWAQPDWTSSTTPDDTVFIKLNVAMTGFEFIFDYQSSGNTHTAPSVTPSMVGTDTSFFDFTGSDAVSPCEIIHEVFFIENTGGITADMDIWLSREDTVTGSDAWSLVSSPSAHTCANTAENQYISGYLWQQGTSDYDGDASTPAAPTWIDMVTSAPSGSPATDQLDDLVAEDPENTGDFTSSTPVAWSTVQNDRAELHLEVLIPFSSTSTKTHSFLFNVMGKISDD
ncbi:hypothetical protein J7M00_01060 [bacterium]|nr:hypothetical protein [bacterium]